VEGARGWWLTPGLPLALTLRDQLPNLGYEFVRNIHYRIGRLDAGLILHQSIFLGLLLVMDEHSPHFLFIPIGWKLVFAHCCFLFLGPAKCGDVVGRSKIAPARLLEAILTPNRSITDGAHSAAVLRCV